MLTHLATYIHDLDPVIVSLGPLKLRWYGLAYLIGFIAAYYILRWFSGKKLWVLPQDKVGDFITYGAFFGVFLGGRLGHLLFYHTVNEGPGWLINDPLRLFRVWEGGMASHGGILGLVIFCYVYSRRQKVSWLGMGDGLVVVCPIGLFTGRMANFINGEIYGKVSDGISWAVKFPQTLIDQGLIEQTRYAEAAHDAIDAAPSLIGPENQMPTFQALVETSRQNDAVKEAIGQHLEPRHPAQVYEALTEGLLLFIILFTIRILFPKLPAGTLTGLFFILYAAARIFCEQFKISETADILGMTMGSFLSVLMILGGTAFLIYSVASSRKSAEP